MGRDVESMVRDLVDQSVSMVRTEMMKTVEGKAKEAADERILDILLPPTESKQQAGFGFSFGTPTISRPASNGNSHEHAPEDPAKESADSRTRERLKAKLTNGELEDREIEIEITHVPTVASMQIMGPMGGGMDDISQNISDALSNVLPKRKKTRRVTVKEARTIFQQEEAAKLIDQDAVAKEAIERAQNSGIIFIDEIDKVAGKSKEGGGPDVSREGVQRDLLPIVEGTTVATRQGPVSTDHILFIASGAFHVSKPSDLIPELQGRFPIRVELQS